MEKTVHKPPNLRTENWRNKQLNTFRTHFTVATDKIADLMGGGIPQNKIREWYEPGISGAYSVHGSTSIENALEIFKIDWQPLDQSLKRYNISLFPQLQGHGYGLKINQIIEELSRALGVKRLVLASITNDRWHKRLLKEGFHQDINDPHSVFKDL